MGNERLTTQSEIRQMLDRFSHDLRSPLTAIKASADLLRNAPEQLDQNTRAELIVIIDEEATRLNRAIERLSWIARLELREVELTRAPYQLADLIESACEQLSTELDRARLTLLLGELPAISVDPALLKLVFQYLLDNAVRFSPAGSEISISAQTDKNHFKIVISDQGCGIKVEDREQVFDKLYRPARRLDEGPVGVGMSLAICRGIIELHNGRIWIDGLSGADIHIELPIEPIEPIE